MKQAFLVVDVQNDFLPGGALAVPQGDEVIAPINLLMRMPFDLFIATKDYHPANHISFASRWQKKTGDKVQIDDIEQILWPDHCIQGTQGSELASNLDVSKVSYLVLKGQNPEIDSYSSFFDNIKQHATGLYAFLQQKGITKIYIAGVATNFCVLHSVRDAIELGFQVVVVTDACRGIETAPGAIQHAFDEMRNLGAQLMDSKEIIDHWTFAQ